MTVDDETSNKHLVTDARTSAAVQRSGITCEKCHVFCNNVDMYAAHIRSAEHQKVSFSFSLHAAK